jgi:hypothetical protein
MVEKTFATLRRGDALFPAGAAESALRQLF